MNPGLVSITFRKLSPREIIELCLRDGLRCIEWGGDVHVPHGDEKTASKVGEMTHDAGLSVAAYGSYYRLASSEGPDFRSVLASAVALGAPVIRVWAGNRRYAESDAGYINSVVSDALRCADLAAAHHVVLAYEFHDNTLTNTTESALALLNATDHPFIKILWQPPQGLPLRECLDSLRALMPRIQHIHVFHWLLNPFRRMPLSEGRVSWSAYIGELRTHGKECDLLLEFVRDDEPEYLRDDAIVLRELSAS